MSALEQLEVRPVCNILRDYISQVIAEGGSEITYESLIAGAQAELGNDEEFVLAAARDIVPALMPELFRQAMHHRRSLAKTGHGWLNNKKGGINLTARDRILLVYEATGQGSYRKLTACTKLDLCNSRDRNLAQVATQAHWAKLEDEYQALLENDDDVLGAVVPMEVLEEIWDRYFPEAG